MVSAQGTFEATTEDVGGHGCQLVSPRLVRKGEPIQLVLAHEAMRDPLRVAGRVAWASDRAPWRLGIAYDEAALSTSLAWFEELLSRVPGLSAFKRIPDRIAMDAVVYLASPPRFLVDFTPDEVAVLRSLGSGTSVAELRSLLRDRWNQAQRALFSLLAHQHVTLARGGSVHPDAWKKILSEAESSIAVEALRTAPVPDLTPSPLPLQPQAAPARPGSAPAVPARPPASRPAVAAAPGRSAPPVPAAQARAAAAVPVTPSAPAWPAAAPLATPWPDAVPTTPAPAWPGAAPAPAVASVWPDAAPAVAAASPWPDPAQPAAASPWPAAPWPAALSGSPSVNGAAAASAIPLAPDWGAPATPAEAAGESPDWLVPAVDLMPASWPMAGSVAPPAPPAAPPRGMGRGIDEGASWRATPPPLTGGFALPAASPRSQEAQGCYERALAELEAGRLAGATALLRRALALAPGDAEIAGALARVSERRQRG